MNRPAGTVTASRDRVLMRRGDDGVEGGRAGSGDLSGGDYPLVVIGGPTGSGKSALAVRVALRLGGEVVNCDSIQVYRHFDLGAAKLSEAERHGVPHHLIDVVEPDETFTAGEYARRARKVLDEIRARERLPVVAGGTGFYLRALVEGLFPAPEKRAGLRERLEDRERRRSGSLHRILRRLDAAAAERIHARDVNKTIRALEVCLAGGRPLSEQWQAGRDRLRGYEAIQIVLAPPREELNRRLAQRLEAMFAGGLIEETRAIRERGFGRECKPFEALGYRQALAVIEGRMSAGEALEEAKKATRQYAKRQMTWFRREPEALWFEGFGDEAEVEEAVLAALRERLPAGLPAGVRQDAKGP